VIYVDQARGNDANLGSSDKPKRSIKSALNSVAENGTIDVASGQYTGSDNVNFSINKSVSINGHDAAATTINGNNNQIWTITADKTVTINGLTFLNGKNDQGGAINNLGELTINSCVLKNNMGGVGGAVYNKHNLKISNSQFLNNNANQGNGLGGAIYSRQGLCNITGSYFANNVASGDGGAINNNYGGDMVLVNTKFQNNNARTAAAISNAQDCNIISCEFIKNTADRMGGAIYSLGNLNIDDSQFKENTARFDVGGAIGIENTDPSFSTKITNTNFTKNHATSNGAISSNGKLILSKTNFNNNRADGNGGALGSSQSLQVEESTFLNNRGDKYGGAVCCFGSLSNFNNNNFVNNSAEVGGAVLITGASFLNANHFTGNKAKQGGAIYNSFRGDASYPSAKFSSNDLTKNSAEELGGAIANTGAITMSMNNFTMNQIASQGYGGAILNSNGTIYIDAGNEFFHNVINENIMNSGGGISNFDGHIFVSGQGNHFTDSNILNNGYMDLSDCVIEKNTEDGNYLDNRNSKGFSQSNSQIIESNHYYQTITQENYDHYVLNGENHTGKGAPTHFDYVSSVNANKGSKVHVKSQLWTHSYWPWDVRIEDVKVKFVLYDKTGKYVDEVRTTSWWGYAEVDIETSNLKPGDYCLLVSYGGEDPSNNKIKNPAYLSCLRSVPFTVTG
jgi:predicted outer membrane repeat protein